MSRFQWYLCGINLLCTTTIFTEVVVMPRPPFHPPELVELGCFLLWLSFCQRFPHFTVFASWYFTLFTSFVELLNNVDKGHIYNILLKLRLSSVFKNLASLYLKSVMTLWSSLKPQTRHTWVNGRVAHTGHLLLKSFK